MALNSRVLPVHFIQSPRKSKPRLRRIAWSFSLGVKPSNHHPMGSVRAVAPVMREYNMAEQARGKVKVLTGHKSLYF
ncbi:predicted protein [Coccidioides posadasii str. Silveira]|uniref:Predicted protein n=1 Tax=Coccidioides posadasii (strain RMSCC 757 / Silveira) TaxID=443226 RepID=E9D5F4_COCPS|nr:predicted protein [Coccidioides posadasii str. Silveira]